MASTPPETCFSGSRLWRSFTVAVLSRLGVWRGNRRNGPRAGRRTLLCSVLTTPGQRGTPESSTPPQRPSSSGPGSVSMQGWLALHPAGCPSRSGDKPTGEREKAFGFSPAQKKSLPIKQVSKNKTRFTQWSWTASPTPDNNTISTFILVFIHILFCYCYRYLQGCSSV